MKVYFRWKHNNKKKTSASYKTIYDEILISYQELNQNKRLYTQLIFFYLKCLYLIRSVIFCAFHESIR